MFWAVQSHIHICGECTVEHLLLVMETSPDCLCRKGLIFTLKPFRFTDISRGLGKLHKKKSKRAICAVYILEVKSVLTTPFLLISK